MSSWAPYSASDYLDFPALSRWCHDLAAAHPGWVRLGEIGKSRHGLPLHILTLGAAHLDAATTPAIWIDAGTHASEWCGVSAAIYATSRWIEKLAAGDAELTEWFSHNLAIIIPCISPDGYQAMVEGAAYLRSSLRPPRHDEPRSGLSPCDLNGDGAVRWMRWRHPAGALIQDEDVPMFMRPRTLDDDPEDAWMLCAEGEFVEWDGESWVSAAREFGIDLNRNFPSHWTPFSMFGMDAGAFPMSEPEARALVEAFERHAGICAALTHHTYTGCILTQPYRQDTPLGAADISLMHTLAQELAQGTGYAVYKVCPDFMYDVKKPTVGVWSDTISTVFGVPGYTVEFWDPYGFAGMEVERPAEFFVNPDPDITRAMLKAFSKVDGAMIPWQPFEHPQLGQVELGGIDYLHTVRNPPTGLLARECEKGFVMSERLRRAIPKVTARVDVTRLGEGCHEVRLTLENVGFLGTHGLEHAEQIGATPGVHARLECAAGVERIAGSSALHKLAHMPGWGALRAGAAKHMIYASLGERAHRQVARWVVQGEGEVAVKYRAGRAGMAELKVYVGGEDD